MIGVRGSRSTAPPPVFGREEILEETNRLLERAKGGVGLGLLLTGSGGVGKTQLLNAIVQQSRKAGFTVLTGRALPEELPPAFSLLREVLASERTSHANLVAPAWTTARAGSGMEPVSSRGVGLNDPSGEIAVTQESDEFERVLSPLGRTDSEGLGASRDELFARLERHFLDRARERPVLIAIDDLQFADASTLEFLRRFSSELPRTPFAIVATVADSADLPERTRGAIESLNAARNFRAVPVRPMTVPETEQFVQWILGGRPAEQDDVRRWHAQTDGNPLFVEQIVRSATGYGAPASAGEGTARGVTEMLMGRVASLGDRERRVLTYAAVLGKEFDFSDLSAVAGSGEERVTESLDRLVHDGLVREKGGEVYEFVSEAVRRDLYTNLTETRRRILHARSGRALEAKGGASDSELARHFYLGREDAKAVEFNLKAAHAATRDFDFPTAVSHVARALEAERRRVDRDRRREIRLLTEQGRLLEEEGEIPRSEELLSEAVDLARKEADTPLELGRALVGLAQTQVDRSGFERAAASATEALALLEKAGTARDLMAGHRVLGTVAWRRGDFPAAELHQRAALEVAEREGTPRELGHALVDVANTLVPVGATKIEPALELYRRAAELFEKAGDFGARARVLMNQSVMEYHTGRPDDAIRDLTKAIEAAERSRSPLWIGYCNLNLAQYHAERGHPDLARPPLARAMQAFGGMGDKLGEQQVEMIQGIIAEAERDYGQAEVHYQSALSMAKEMRAASEFSEMLFRLAHLAVERGEWAAARRWLSEARESGLQNFRPDFAERLSVLEKSIEAGG